MSHIARTQKIGHSQDKSASGKPGAVHLDGVTDVFDDKPKASKEPEIDVKSLHAKIGQLTLENDFLGEALAKAGLLGSAKK